MYQPERDFVSCARERMQLLSSGEHVGAAALDAALQMACLEDISASAKTVTARAVMVCANRCASGLNDGADIGFDLATLGRLIEQFASGLAEIDFDAPKANIPAAKDIAVIEMPVSNDNRKAAAARAASTLEPLIANAPQNNRAALTRLIAVSAGEQVASPAAVSDNAPLAEKFISLESLIAPVTSSALSRAHLAHKRISLSYACEGVFLHEDVAISLQKLLSALCDVFISGSVRHPGVREAAGLSGTSQIAFTASDGSAGLSFDVFCDDNPLSADALQSSVLTRAIAGYQAIGGQFEAAQGRAAGSLLSITHKTPRKKPRLASHDLELEPMRLRSGERA